MSIDKAYKSIDKYSGIDAIQITKDNQIRTLAMRVQYGKAGTLSQLDINGYLNQKRSMKSD